MNPRIAIIGSGISGLSAAHVLQKNTSFEITLFKAGYYFEGIPTRSM
jgi:predicted NAD/FAD-binding protein